MAEMKIQI